jgi:cytochrome c2
MRLRYSLIALLSFMFAACGTTGITRVPEKLIFTPTFSPPTVSETPHAPSPTRDRILSPTVPTGATPSPSPTHLAVATRTVTVVPGDAAAGKQLFASLPCASCHDVKNPFPGGDICPNLGNIAAEAERIIQLPEYHASATDAASYIRESILNPNAYLVPGEPYRAADGSSVMPKNFSKILTLQQVDDLVAYLLTLK